MKNTDWRPLRHPLRIGLRGWKWHPAQPGIPGHITSPRGTAFVVRRTQVGYLAKPYVNHFELSAA